jgi:hypothetical protein
MNSRTNAGSSSGGFAAVEINGVVWGWARLARTYDKCGPLFRLCSNRGVSLVPCLSAARRSLVACGLPRNGDPWHPGRKA